VEQRRDWCGQAEARREDGEIGVEATVGGKDSAGREVGENVMGMVVTVKVSNETPPTYITVLLM
jgi:hypothetical protein